MPTDLDSVLEFLRAQNGLYSVSVTGVSQQRAGALSAFIQSLNLDYIGAPEIESALAENPGSNDAEIAQQLIIEECARTAYSIGHDDFARADYVFHWAQ